MYWIVNADIKIKELKKSYEDYKKNIWIGTSGGGLNIFNAADNTFNIINNYVV